MEVVRLVKPCLLSRRNSQQGGLDRPSVWTVQRGGAPASSGTEPPIPWRAREPGPPQQLCPPPPHPAPHLAGAELADEQRAALGVLPPVQAVQLGGHLAQLLVRVVELCQQLRIRPLRRGGVSRRPVRPLTWPGPCAPCVHGGW